MDKYASTIFMGGVGNMMFQAAMLHSYCKKYGYDCVLTTNHTGTLHTHPQEYKNNIFRNFKFLQSSEVKWHLCEEPQENKPCKYTKLENLGVDNILFKGFFQSYKYFEEDLSEVQALFSPDDVTLNRLKLEYPFLFKEEYVSLHVRRGNYTTLSQFHHNLSLGYYKNSIDYFRGYKFLVFSDDIEWCKKHFRGEEFTFIGSKDDYIDLYLMSYCKHHIIANSTFSWWGAHLNPSKDKIVIHPNKWFGEANNSLDISDLYPPTWVCLDENFPKATINLMGGVCKHLTKPNGRWSTVHGKISSNLRIVRNYSSFKGVSIFSDDTIESNLFLDINSTTKIGWLIEPREVFPSRYQNFKNYYKNYDYILTHDYELLEKYPNNTKFVPFGGCWIKDYNFRIFPKSKLISIILSNKNHLPGHKLRHQIVDCLEGLDLYGRGTSNPIEYKEEGLKDYYFSITIENSKTPNFFTEKLMDCFATGTIPIYWGCPNIGDFFDTEGMIIIDNIYDLSKVLPLLTPEYYNSKSDSIKKNLELCKDYNVTEDWIFKNILDNEK